VWQHVARLLTAEPLARQHLSALILLGVLASYHFWLADDAGTWLCGWEDLPSHDRHPMGEVQLNRALLCQEVGQLLVRRSLFNFQCAAGDHRSKVMVLHIYVLGAQAH